MEDAELVRQLQKGDRTAFDELYNRYKNDVLRTACMITGSRSDGEDVTQEAFVQCYLMIRQLRDPSRFRAWLFRLMTRAAWKTCRTHKREQPVDTFFDEGVDESALSAVLRTEQSRILYEAVQALDEKHRTVIVLYYYNDMAVQEIARVMQCREGTVKSRLHAARRSLQKNISPEFLEGVRT